jgi:DNA-binding transcriptional regulator YiaG
MNIKEARKKFGMTRKELAEQIGCSHRTIEYWEQGRGNPNKQALKLIEKMLAFKTWSKGVCDE